MKKSIFRLLTVVPMLFVLTFTNIYEDPSNLFHNVCEDVAEAIVSGNYVYISSSNLNERTVRYNLIKSMPDKVDCVAMGPSLVMCVNSGIVGEDTFYNLGVSGGELYSLLEQLGMMEEYGKEADRIILCVDSFLFDEQTSPSDQIVGAYRSYSAKMLNRIGCDDVDADINGETNVFFETLNQAFSITYFQAAQKQIEKRNSFLLQQPRWGILDDDRETMGSNYGPDGSWYYASNQVNAGVQDVIKDCNSYDMENMLAKGRHASPFSLDVFEKVIAYLTKQGVEVELFMCPLAPSLWNRVEINKSDYYILDEAENLVDRMVEKYNVKVTGSYNPYELGMSDADFYDARHVRRELLGEYFDFTGK